MSRGVKKEKPPCDSGFSWYSTSPSRERICSPLGKSDRSIEIGRQSAFVDVTLFDNLLVDGSLIFRAIGLGFVGLHLVVKPIQVIVGRRLLGPNRRALRRFVARALGAVDSVGCSSAANRPCWLTVIMAAPIARGVTPRKAAAKRRFEVSKSIMDHYLSGKLSE